MDRLIVRHCSKDAESFSVYCSCGYKKENSAWIVRIYEIGEEQEELPF